MSAIQESDGEMLSLKDQIMELEHQLELQHEDYSASLMEIDRLRGEASNSNANGGVDAELYEAKLVCAMNEQMASQRHISELKDQIGTLQQLLSNKEQETSLSDKTSGAKVHELQQVVERFRSELGLRESEISNLMNTNAELLSKAEHQEKQASINHNQVSKAMDDDQVMKKKFSQLQMTLNLALSEKDNLIQKLADRASEVKLLNQQLATMETESAETIKTLTRASSNANEVKSELHRYVDTVKTLELALADERGRNIDLKGRLAEANKHIDKLESVRVEMTQCDDSTIVKVRKSSGICNIPWTEV